MTRLARLLPPAAALVLVASSAFSTTPASGDISTCQGVPATIRGTDGAEYIVGTTGNDVIQANSGDDTVRGLAGNDLICGGEGDDLVSGGAGTDRIYSEGGNDELQSSDPWVYCSTSDSSFSETLTAFQSPTDLAFLRCIPQTGRSLTAQTIPDGGTKNLFMNVQVPQGSGNLIRDINVRVYINAPKVNGVPDVCQLHINLQSATGTINSMASNDCNNTGTDLTGTSLDSEAIFVIRNVGGTNRALNGRFHPAGSLDAPYRNTPVCSSTSCTWKLSINDNKKDGNAGSISWWSVEINYGTSSSDGADDVVCGSGNNDTVDYTARNAALTVTMNDHSANDGQSGEHDNVGGDDSNRCEWLYTGFGNDLLTGNDVFNDIRSSAGADKIWTLGGDDRTRGGIGNDVQYGGDGNDKLDGNDGADTSDGGPGTDRCLNSETRISCEATR